MPDDQKDIDLEERRRQLEERRRMLERRRQELSRRKHEEPARPTPAPPRKPPERPAPPPPPKPPTPPPKEKVVTKKIEPQPPKQAPPPSSAARSKPTPPPPPPPPKRTIPKPEVKPPAPPPKPEPPKSEPPKPTPPKPKKETTPPVDKAEVARAAAPASKSKTPMYIGIGVVAVAIIIGVILIIMNSGKAERDAQEAAQQQAIQDSIRTAQMQNARSDSIKRVLNERIDEAVTRLEEQIEEADGLQASSRSPNDFEQAKAYFDQAVQAREQGLSQQALSAAETGLDRISSAISTSQRIQRQEDQAKASRDEALSMLRSNIAALEESLSVLSEAGAQQYAAVMFQRLQAAVESAKSSSNSDDLKAGNEQVEQAFDLITQTRSGIGDGKRQEAEARELLRIRAEQARQESIRQAELNRRPVQQTPAKLIKLAPVQYPSMAKQAGIKGIVTVEFTIGEDGKSRDFKIIEGLPAGCDDAAIDAIRNSQFEPATQGGQPVATRMRLNISFKG